MSSENIPQNAAKPKSQKLRSYLIKALSLALGVGILYYVINDFGGLEKITVALKKVGWGYLLVVLSSFAGILFFTEAWRQFLPKGDHPIRFLSLLKVRLCGEGINFMTPAGFIAGDPIKMVLLQKYLGPNSQMRSVVADRVMHTLAAHVINLVGLILLITGHVPIPLIYSWSLIIFYVITTVLIANFTVDMLTGQGLGMLDTILLKFKFAKHFPKANQKLEDLKDELVYYKDRPKWPFYKSFLLHFIGRAFGIVEIAIILWCLEGRWEWQFSYMLAALVSFVTVACGFIPGAVGPLESLSANFAIANGFEPQIGIAIQLIRRLRSFLWIGVGVYLLDYKHVTAKLTRKK